MAEALKLATSKAAAPPFMVVLDLTKAPSLELGSHNGHGQELSSSHPLILMAPYLTGLMMAPL
uniref:Uncharacterized protein n=1 Tax=Fagus sylvatica TaxID=28930 RepID=A0A2N9I1K6_FAGSY